MSGQVSGSGGVVKNGSGILTLGGGAGDATTNPVTGMTINSGTVTLDKASGTSALGGNVLLNDGTLSILRTGNIVANTNVTQNFGTLTANGGPLTLGSWSFSAGLISGVSSLTLSGTAANVMTWNTSFNATVAVPINFTGPTGGGFAQTGTGVITLPSPINLGNLSRTFTINDIPAVVDDQVISGAISAGGINKFGAGTLTLTGPIPLPSEWLSARGCCASPVTQRWARRRDN